MRGWTDREGSKITENAAQQCMRIEK